MARFRALDACLPEGPGNLTVSACVSLDNEVALAAINPKSRWVAVSASALAAFELVPRNRRARRRALSIPPVRMPTKQHRNDSFFLAIFSIVR